MCTGWEEHTISHSFLTVSYNQIIAFKQTSNSWSQTCERELFSINTDQDPLTLRCYCEQTIPTLTHQCLLFWMVCWGRRASSDALKVIGRMSCNSKEYRIWLMWLAICIDNALEAWIPTETNSGVALVTAGWIPSDLNLILDLMCQLWWWSGNPM